VPLSCCGVRVLAVRVLAWVCMRVRACVRAFRVVFIEPSVQVTSVGTSTPTGSAPCAVEQQQIEALEAAHALLNATVAAQAAEIAGLRSRLLGRSEAHYAPASTPIAEPPPPPPPYLPSGDGGTATIPFLRVPPLRAPMHSQHTSSFLCCRAHISSCARARDSAQGSVCACSQARHSMIALTLTAEPLHARPPPCAQVRRSVRTALSRTATCCRHPRVKPAVRTSMSELPPRACPMVLWASEVRAVIRIRTPCTCASSSSCLSRGAQEIYPDSYHLSCEAHSCTRVDACADV
jgi:hypothetical protein